jgi:hypothetical protein
VAADAENIVLKIICARLEQSPQIKGVSVRVAGGDIHIGLQDRILVRL